MCVILRADRAPMCLLRSSTAQDEERPVDGPSLTRRELLRLWTEVPEVWFDSLTGLGLEVATLIAKYARRTSVELMREHDRYRDLFGNWNIVVHTRCMPQLVYISPRGCTVEVDEWQVTQLELAYLMMRRHVSSSIAGVSAFQKPLVVMVGFRPAAAMDATDASGSEWRWDSWAIVCFKFTCTF